MLPKEQIETIHPLFKLPQVQLFWNGMVTRYDKGNSCGQRLLIIASPGVFLFEKTLLSGYKMTQTVAYSEMTSLKCVDDRITLATDKKSIEFSTTAQVTICSYIIGIQNSLFIPMNIDISSDMRTMIDDVFFVFETKSPICDRFISLSIPSLDTIDVSAIANDADYLSGVSNSIQFSAESVASPCIKLIIEALSYDPLITAIVFSSINFHEFVEYLQMVISTNKHINSIKFQRIVFKGESSELVNFFKTKVSAPISNIEFYQCELSSNKFTNLLLAFSTFKCRITSISARDCSFSDETLRALFICLFQSPCFNQLQEFILVGDLLPGAAQELALELLNPNISTFSPSFYHIRLSSSYLDATSIITEFTSHPSQITILDLSRSCIKTEFPTSITSFSKLTELNISNTWTTPDALFSLFKVISRANPSIYTVIADHIHMNEAKFVQFYSNFEEISCPSVRRLSWENNLMRNPESVEKFFFFISKLPNILDLSISNSLMASDQTTDLITNYIKSAHLQRFILRGYDKTAFGNKFVQILQALSEHETLISLDCTGQGFDDEGIQLLAKMIENGLKSLAWDEQCPQDPQLTFDVLMKTLCQEIEFTLWPEENLKYLWTNMPIHKRNDFNSAAQEIKGYFVEKYSSICHDCLSNKNSYLEKSRLPRCNTEMRLIKPIPKIDFQALARIPDKIDESFKEISGSIQEDFLTIETKRLVSTFLFNQLAN